MHRSTFLVPRWQFSSLRHRKHIIVHSGIFNCYRIAFEERKLENERMKLEIEKQKLDVARREQESRQEELRMQLLIAQTRQGSSAS